MVNERDDLRRYVRRVMGKTCLWVEPNVKSTIGAGVPDCRFKVDGKEVPVELKYWHRTKLGVKCEMRPAQIRYHVMGAKKGNRSAILFGIDVPGSAGEFFLYLIPNHKCPKEPYALKKNDARLVGTSSDWDGAMNFKIVEILSDERFWNAQAN